MQVHANVFLKFDDGTSIETSVISYSFKEIMELVCSSQDSFSEEAQASLEKLADEFEDMFFNWATPAIHHLSNWTEWDSQTSVPTTTGKYYLTKDVTISSTVKIAPDQEVTLCLNGHKINASARIYYVSGVLNICDCCHAKPESSTAASLRSTTTYSPS